MNLTECIAFGIWLGFGGLDVLYHAILHLMLWHIGKAPLRLITCLDAASHQLYLCNVGGGYMFIHQ